MLNGLMNIIAPADKVKGAQLALGRARKSLELRTREHTEACAQVIAAASAIDQAPEEGPEFESAKNALQEAYQQCDQAENILVIARQRHQNALTALQQAERLVSVEKEVDALTHLKFTVGAKVDQALADLEKLVREELVPALNASRAAGGNGSHMNALEVARLEFGRALHTAIVTLLPGRIAAPASPGFLKHTRWSDFLPDPDIARTRSRES